MGGRVSAKRPSPGGWAGAAACPTPIGVPAIAPMTGPPKTNVPAGALRTVKSLLANTGVILFLRQLLVSPEESLLPVPAQTRVVV